MATAAQWVEGARLRTLPAAISPVLAGTGAALVVQPQLPWGRAVLALIVALALQVGVNFANDYSDGVRGTDAERVGPMRLVGSGAAAPRQVKWAAFGSFGVAASCGLALVAMTGHWWLLAVGAACIAAAWWYTGGKHPYGYAGFGEVFVFVFFGVVAVTGTTFVLVGTVPKASWAASVGMGTLACAILVTNNLRDIDGDLEAGKRTLTTYLGDAASRRFYLVLCSVAAISVGLTAVWSTWWVLLGLAAGVGLLVPIRTLVAGATGKQLISVLKWTGVAQLMCAIGLFVGFTLMTVNG